MRITREDVVHVARLARLDLDDDELETFTGQLGDILDHAARVEALDTSGVEPTAHPVPLANVLRPDERGRCLDRDGVLAQAPEAENGYFRVPRIMDAGS
ncbi:MAG: Asp-tRNA(Asn)/Glu-tRNA(Gln) amidotransferase subunit GatC [Acidimicrobiia bacterium]|nr:Asp-tRNA(Asn)/Glu-tRNA(Gln) amidotransferase subunit GatC [Acidimicrobiia bacterium]